MPQNVGFVSTRFAGTDGVSLESAKWAEVLWHHKHVSYWYAGKLDRADHISMHVPEAYFDHPDNVWINDHVYGKVVRPREVTQGPVSPRPTPGALPPPFPSPPP